jgi:ketosteroid isomerase-like protein
MTNGNPEDLIEEYGRQMNTHRFEAVAPLIDQRALFWFSDGSTHEGLGAIREAFERNWRAIRNEVYRIEDVRWLAREDSVAVCVYRFRWEGETHNGYRSAEGRGTSVLCRADGVWRVRHEHLSRPAP